jgi:hypothetical protein
MGARAPECNHPCHLCINMFDHLLEYMIVPSRSFFIKYLSVDIIAILSYYTGRKILTIQVMSMGSLNFLPSIPFMSGRLFGSKFKLCMACIEGRSWLEPDSTVTTFDALIQKT